ncbi:MAG: hypothetical protein MJ204_02685 [Bacteroidales bacterium]|nr:hypothetical protein [Bacteroidales bacterium]MCQ2605434.1 hypothetical protein [Bacteroidales bacterium]
MEKLNITQLTKRLESGEKVEAKQFQLVVSVDGQNNQKTQTVFRAIVNRTMYEITAGTFKKLVELLKRK